MLDSVISHGAAARVLDVVLVEPVPNLRHGRALIVPLEYFRDKGRRKGIRLKMLLCINDVTDWDGPAIVLSLECVLSHPTHHLLGQVGGIVFGVAFQYRLQDDTLRPIRDDLGGGHQLDTILFELRLIAGAVVAVAGEAVQLPDQNDIKQLALAVLDHLLELGPVVRLGRDGAVDVVPHHGDAVLLGISGALADLAFDGFFALVVRGISGVDNGGHGGASLRMNVQSKQSFV